MNRLFLYFRLWVGIASTTLLILVEITNVVAATITVNDSNGAIIPNSQCSISEAVFSANNDIAPNDDCVDGDVGRDIIKLTVDVILTERIDTTYGSNGTPSITSAITLDGQGYQIQRDSALTACVLNTIDDSHEFRLFYIGASGNLTIHNLTLLNGCADGDPAQSTGGAIYNRGHLEISSSMIQGNQARSGGGVFNGYDGMITSITGTTISENSAGHSGGGIYNSDDAEIDKISNSTFSGNSSNYQGGGIYNYGGTVNMIFNSTFAGNSAILEGGGIQNLYYGVIGDFSNNIITNSTNGDCKNESFSTFNGSNNLIDSIINCPSGLRKQAITNFDTSLADNGCAFPGPHGCVETHALLTHSNAVDEAVSGTTADQRGFAVMRTRDIGAYERQVEILSDCPSGLQVDGFITSVSTPSLLHQAILCANFNGNGNTDNIMLTSDIELTGFATDSPTGIYNAEGKNGTPSVESKVVLNGQGHTLLRMSLLNCNLNRIAETGEFRLLHIGSIGDLNVQNLVFENGCADDDVEKAKGGALFNQGKLSIFNTAMFNNQAHRHGGGLFNDDSAEISSIANTTFTENFAGRGGGIYISGTLMALTNSTFSGNSVSDSGGAIFNSDTISEINNCTFTGNTADYYAGGIYNIGNLTYLANTIITNSTGSVLTDCYSANNAIIGGSNNLIDNTANCGPTLSIGSVTNLNPVLSDNGCTYVNSSGCVKTHALLAGSNALDAAFNGTSYDQRGYAAFNGRDIGSWESADQDNDGLGEADEIELGTKPNDSDTDKDDLRDGEEVSVYGTNPVKPDTDGDGYSDGDEVKAGTDPNDPNDYPSNTSISVIINYLLK